jgi:putative transcriptional regulator
VKSRLRVLRAGLGWTQEGLAETVGVSRQAINALETERHDPSLDLAYRVAAAFGLPVEQVFPNPHEQGPKS